MKKLINELLDKNIFFVGLILAGLYSIITAVFDWDWYFNNKKTKMACDLLGRKTIRVMQVIFGLFVISVSTYWLISRNVK